MAKSAKASGGQGALAYIAEPLRGLAVPIGELHPDPSNARKHNDKNIEAIIASLHRFGQRIPIVVQRQGMVVRAGNGRLEAAKRMGWTHVAAVVVDEASVDATAYAIADNRTAELAEWDDETLAALLQSLPEDVLPASGFDEDDLKELLNGLTPDIVEDEAPEPLAEAVTRTGDVWLLGRHRLLCGDSTKGEDVADLLRTSKPHLMVTDPPYGVEYDANWRNDADRANGKPYGASAVGKVENDARADWTEAWALFPGDVAYVWHADRHASEVQASLEAADFAMRSQIVWAKSVMAISRGDYHWQHEPCWYAVRNGKTGHWAGDRKQTTLWSIPKPQKSETGHSTQKPVECMAWPVRNNSVPGDVVYEPFSGSGTTIVACDQLDRACYAIEIAPVYVDVAVRRWEKLTGKQATLESTGKTWRETAEERGVNVNEPPPNQ